MSIKITDNGVVHYENENDVNRTLFPNDPNTKEIYDKLDTIQRYINNPFYRLNSMIGTITIPEGSSGVQTATINIANAVPEGYFVANVFIKIGSYILPYFLSDGTGCLWVSNIENNIVTISNRGSVLRNYNYHVILICVKNG